MQSIRQKDPQINLPGIHPDYVITAKVLWILVSSVVLLLVLVIGSGIYIVAQNNAISNYELGRKSIVMKHTGIQNEIIGQAYCWHGGIFYDVTKRQGRLFTTTIEGRP